MRRESRVAAFEAAAYIDGTLATDTRTMPASVTPRLGRKGEEQQRVDPKSLQPLRRLVPFILRYKTRVLLTLVFLLIAAVSTLVIPALAGRIVRFRFNATRGRLYAFWVSVKATGESGGYPAAGGPSFSGPIDA